MSAIIFDESFILRFDAHLTNTEVLSAMADNLCKRGIVKETYKKAILDREQEFPTGLNTGGINVAIPHADISHVNKAAICVGILKEPAAFHAMDEPDYDVPVKLVIMLALTEAHGHIEMLQKIVGLIQDQAAVKEITETDDSEKAGELISRFLLEEKEN